jgi:AraC family transcriptional regulator
MMRRRTEMARWLLIHTDKPLADIAFDCGFFDQSHFTNVFRRRTGASPGAFRREQGTRR